jgi:glyoxylase-like metal-dependent hydrolase (beta-lactamase superfamily II)
MNESPTILSPGSAQAEDARQPGTESLNGNGLYRFKIGDFQATVISDGYGLQIPVGPIFAMNASEAELAPVLRAARENLPPVANRSWFVKEGGEIASGVHYIVAPGHLPSHASILFTSDKEQFVHKGDIAHNPVTSLQQPECGRPSSTTIPCRRSNRARPFWTASRPMGSW